MFRLIELIFKSYIKEQKAVYEITKRLFDGSIKYSNNDSIGENKQYRDNRSKKITFPPEDNKLTIPYKKITITYDDGSFSGPMEGKFPTPTSRITNTIKKMSKDLQGKPELIYIAESFTSQMCNRCKIKSFANVISAGSKLKVHAVPK